MKRLESPSNLIQRWFHRGRGVLSVTVLALTVLIGNLLQMITVVVRPWSRRSFTWLNTRLAGVWWGFAVVWSKWNGVRMSTSGDELPAGENALVISNHQDMPDIVAILMLAHERGRTGDLRWFVKESIRPVPGVGWGLSFLDTVFVKRNWHDDKVIIQQTFRRILENRLPFWLVSFPEGGRINPERLARSHRFAKSRGMNLLNHVIIPRTKGFVAKVEGLRSQTDAVYDLTIIYPDGIPSMWQFLQGLCRRVEVHVRRHPLNSLPTGERDLSRWLMDSFSAKEPLLKEREA